MQQKKAQEAGRTPGGRGWAGAAQGNIIRSAAGAGNTPPLPPSNHLAFLLPKPILGERETGLCSYISFQGFECYRAVPSVPLRRTDERRSASVATISLQTANGGSAVPPSAPRKRRPPAPPAMWSKLPPSKPQVERSMWVRAPVPFQTVEASWSGWPVRGVRVGEAEHPGPTEPAAAGAGSGLRCLNGHPLREQRPGGRARNGAGQCSRCSRTIAGGTSRLRCSECRFDVCMRCVRAAQGDPEESSQAIETQRADPEPADPPPPQCHQLPSRLQRLLPNRLGMASTIWPN